MNPVSSKNDCQAAWRSGRHAFSLLELLVVIAILAILLVMLSPAIRSIGGGTEMTAAADLVVAQLNLARQMAITKNRNTELRLYSFKNEFGEKRFCGVQIFINPEDASQKPEPAGRMLKLPNSACFDSGSTLSPLIANSPLLAGSTLGDKIPQVGLAYDAVCIGFRPDGSSSTISGDSTQNFLTLRPWRLEDPQTSLPPNYAVVQICKTTGQIRRYRP
jgi:uncharacterized protein (TIGR02596 family)